MITEIQWTKNVFADDAATFATRYEGVSAGVVVYVVESTGAGSSRRFKAWRLTSDGGWHPVGDGRSLRLMRNGKEECEFEWEGLNDATRTAIVNELRDRRQHVITLIKLGVSGAERMTMAELVHAVEIRSSDEAAANTAVTYSAPLPPELVTVKAGPEPVSSRYDNDVTELDGFRLGDVVTFGQWPEHWRVERLLPAEGALASAAALIDINPRRGLGEHRTAGPLRFMRKVDPDPAPAATPDPVRATVDVRVQPLTRGGEFLAQVMRLEPGERRNVYIEGHPAAVIVGVDAVAGDMTPALLAEMRAERDEYKERAELWRGRARERTAERFGDVMRDVLKGWVAGSMENDEARQVRDRVTDPELVVFHPSDFRNMIDDAVREIGPVK